MRHNSLTRPLRQHELLQRLNRHTSPSDTTDGREPRVVPSTYVALVDEPVQLAFREQGVDEVETAEVPDVYGSDAESGDHPVILWIAVAVFVRTECMGDTFDGVDNGTGEIVRRIDLPLVAAIFV